LASPTLEQLEWFLLRRNKLKEFRFTANEEGQLILQTRRTIPMTVFQLMSTPQKWTDWRDATIEDYPLTLTPMKIAGDFEIEGVLTGRAVSEEPNVSEVDPE